MDFTVETTELCSASNPLFLNNEWAAALRYNSPFVNQYRIIPVIFSFLRIPSSVHLQDANVLRPSRCVPAR